MQHTHIALLDSVRNMDLQTNIYQKNKVVILDKENGMNICSLVISDKSYLKEIN